MAEMTGDLMKEDELYFYCKDKKKWNTYWVQLYCEKFPYMEIDKSRTEKTQLLPRVSYISLQDCKYQALQVLGVYKNQPNSFKISLKKATYTFATQTSEMVHEWVTTLHNCIQSTQEICNPYSTFIKSGEQVMSKEGENSRSNSCESPLDPASSLPPQPRKRVSTKEKIKSMFKRTKEIAGKKEKTKTHKASSDTEILERFGIEAMYAQVDKKELIKKQMPNADSIQSPHPLQSSLTHESNQFKSLLQEYHSDPPNTQHTTQIVCKNRVRKRLLTRAQRSINSAKNNVPVSSSSDEERESSSTSRASRKQKTPPTLAKRNFREGSLQELVDNELGNINFPPPPIEPSSDIKEVNSSRLINEFEKNEYSSPPQSMKLPKVQGKVSSIIESSNKKAIVEKYIEPLTLPPEHQITIMKLKTHSSDSENPESASVTTTTNKQVEEIYHPKKKHSVGTSPSPIKSCENNFLFDTQQVANMKQTINESVSPGISHKVFTKKVPNEKQPYVNMIQVVNSDNHTNKLSNPRPNINESRTFEPHENSYNIIKENCQTDVVMTKTFPSKSVSKLTPLRPINPPPMTNPQHLGEIENKINANEEKSNLKLKSSLKSSKLKDDSLVDSCNLTNNSNKSNSKKYQDNSPILKQSGQRVNFGKTTEIPITPTYLSEINEKSSTIPRQNDMRYRSYNDQYGPMDQYYCHSRNCSDSLMYTGGYQNSNMYRPLAPNSMGGPNLARPREPEYSSYYNPYYQDEMHYNKFQQPNARNMDFSMTPHHILAPFYHQPPQLIPFQPDSFGMSYHPNYAYRPQQYNEMIRYTSPSSAPFRPSRPAPAPPLQHHLREGQKRILTQSINETCNKGNTSTTNTTKYETIV